MIYTSIIENFPENMRWSMMQLVEQMRDDLAQTVTKEDFGELKDVISDLGDKVSELYTIQKVTEKRLDHVADRMDQLTEHVDQLTQAQQQTEARLNQLTERVDHLAERMDQLTQAQQQTEARLNQLTERVDHLADRMDQLTERMDQLAEAQRKTEVTLNQLAKNQKHIRQELGGLGHTVGYRLEDEAIWALPELLKRDQQICISEPLKRGYIELAPNRWEEVNIWGHGKKDGQMLAILGEAKSQLKKKEVDEFLKRVQRISEHQEQTVFPVLITYHTSPQVQAYVQESGIALYFSYELRPPAFHR